MARRLGGQDWIGSGRGGMRPASVDMSGGDRRAGRACHGPLGTSDGPCRLDSRRGLDEDQGRDWQNLTASGGFKLALLVRALKLAKLYLLPSALNDLVFDRMPEKIEQPLVMRHGEDPPF